MAQNVHAQVLGGEIKTVEVDTVGDVRKLLEVPNHTASVDGEPAEDDEELADFSFVSFSPAIKGGNA